MVKCTKCHPPLLALSVFTLVSDNKDKNTQNKKAKTQLQVSLSVGEVSLMTATIHDG